MTPPQTLNRGHWLVLAAAFLGWMFDGVEIGLFPLAARPALQELLRDLGDTEVARWNGAIVACFLLGAAGGGILFGWLGDRIGRVRAMVIAVLTYSLFTGAGAFASQAWHLGLCRFIAALGMGGEWAVAVALVVECWPDRFRPYLAGAIGAAANLGTLLIALVAYVRPVMSGSWRWLMLVGATPAVLALLIALLVPESERWKASAKTATQTPLAEIFGPRLWKRTLLAIVFSAIPLIGTWAAISGWIPLWVEQMRQAELVQERLPQLDLGHMEKGKLRDALSAAGRQLPADQQHAIRRDAATAKAGIQIVMAVGAIIGCFVAPIVGGAWGRRPTYFMLCLLSLASAAYLFGRLDSLSLQFVLLTGFVGAATAAFYGWLPLYLPELFPTRVRATGQGLGFNSGRILAAASNLLMGDLVSVFGGDYARGGLTIVMIYVLGMVFIWLAPETKGKPLPD